MATKSDGTVIIDTTIDNDGLKKQLDNLNSIWEKFTSSSKRQLDDVDKAVEKSGKNAKNLKIEPTTDGIEQAVKELDILNAKIENQENLLANYRQEYARVSERFGDTSKKALDLEKKILSCESSIQKMTKSSDKMASEIADAENAMNNAKKAADKFEGAVDDVKNSMNDGAESAGNLEKESRNAGEGMEQAGKGAGVFDVALGSLVANAITVAVSKLSDLTEETKEFRRNMSFLEQNALDAGVSMEYLDSKAGELYGVVGDVNEITEGLSNILASGMNADQAEKAINALAGAATKFPETMKFESMADGLQETIATGEAAGPFAELLDRMSIDVERFNERLEKTDTAASKQRIALETLSKTGLEKVYDSYKKNNEQIIESGKANYKLQKTYADLGKAMEPIETTLKTTLAQALTDNKDEIISIIEGIGGFLDTASQVLSYLSRVPTPLLIIGGALITISGGLLSTAAASAGTAAGMRILSSGAASAATKLSAAGPAAVKAGASFLQLTLEILMVAAAISLVITSISLLISAINGVPAVMINSEINTPSVKDLENKLGYAKGTLSAGPGYKWVGENGPELIKFSGGEQVYNATQTAALRGTLGNTPTYIYNDNRQNIFKVDDIATYQKIESRMKNERIGYRMGYAGG